MEIIQDKSLLTSILTLKSSGRKWPSACKSRCC